MNYKGFKYDPWVEHEDDNMKIFHEIVTPDGARVYADFTPYSYMSEYDFQAWIDLDQPGRISIGPLDSDDLKKIALTMAMVKR